MEIFFGYAAGLLTLINPCVLPVLPVVLASSVQNHRHGPLALAGGMSLSFVALGVFVASIGPSIGIYNDTIAQVASVLMIGFGAVLLIPRLSQRFASATAGFAANADTSMDTIQTTTLRGQFVGGALLGAVWSPCIGPTLGAAIGVASAGGSLIWAGSVMAAFALGVSTVILAIAYASRGALQRRQSLLRSIAAKSRPIMGAVFVIIGLGIFFNIHHMIEAWTLQNLPAWLIDFSVSV